MLKYGLWVRAFLEQMCEIYPVVSCQQKPMTQVFLPFQSTIISIFSCALCKQDLLLSAFSTTNTLFCIMSGGDHRIVTNCLLRLRGVYGLAMAIALCLILLIQVTSRGNTGYPMATSSGFRSFVDKTVKGKRPHILVSSASSSIYWIIRYFNQDLTPMQPTKLVLLEEKVSQSMTA